MNIFEKLLLQLQKDAKNIENKITEIEEENIKIEFYAQIREIIDKLPIEEIVENGRLKELLETGKITIENLEQIFEPKEEILYAKDSINLLKNSIFNINTNLKQLDIENMIEVLNKKQLFNTKDLEYIKNNLITLKETYEIVNNPNFNDSQIKEIITGLKNSLLNLLQSKISEIYTNLLKQTKIICDNVIIKNSKKTANKKYLQEDLKSIKLYLEKFSIDGVEKSFDSLEEMNTFFEYLKSSNLDEEDILLLIISFSKFNIDYFNNLKKQEDVSMLKTIVSNADTITHSMESLISSETIEGILEEDALKLTDEEQEIYNQIKNLFEEKVKTIKSYDKDIAELLSDDFELKTRTDYYLSGGKIDWSLVLSDIKYVLDPNLENNKEKVFEIFKYILEFNKNELENQQENNRQISILKEMNNSLQTIITSKENFLKQYQNLTKSQQNYYKTIYEYILSGDLDSAEMMVSNISKSLEFVKFVCVLNELNDFSLLLKEHIDNNSITQEEIEEYHVYFNNIMVKYNAASQEYANQYIEEENEITEIPKNLIYFMEEDLESNTEIEKKGLFEVLKVFLSDYWENIVKENKNCEPLKKSTPTKELVEYKNEKFEPCRARGTGHTRTGYLKINICNENKEKIRKRYGMDKIGPLLVIIGTITAIRDDHSEYKVLTDYIKDNRIQINELVELFGNPNTDENKLFEIIDKAFELNEQVKNGKFLGGASLK